ncbi:hypothetical protein GCM10027423_60900 [Spirosoma arcticum]
MFRNFVSLFVSYDIEYSVNFVLTLTKQTEIMNSLNDQKGEKTVTADQTNASTVSVHPPAEPNTEDMELNEEQLDIISGGGGRLIKE